MRATRNLWIGVVVFALAALLSVEQANAQSRQGTPPPPAPTTPTSPPPASTMKAQPQKTSVPSTPDEALRDIEQTLGFVPQWIRTAPDALLVGFWVSLKNFQMNPNTALDVKTKELIGLAVAAQIPCEYCIYFHTAAARKNGATDQEIKEALGMSSLTRMASTMLNGSQLDRMAFRKEADRMIQGDKTRSQARRPPTK